MITFPLVVQVYTLGYWLVALLLLALLVSRMLKFRNRPRVGIFPLKENWYPKTVKLLFGGTMLLTMLYTPYLFYIASATKPIVPVYLNHLLVIMMVLLAGWEVYLTFTVSERTLSSRWRKTGLLVIVILLLPVAVSSVMALPEIFRYPADSECILLDLPVRGTWIAAHAGESPVVNQHSQVEAQEYAIDIMCLDEAGDFYRSEGMVPADFVTYGEKIYAPCAGKVVKTENSLEDARIFPDPDSLNPAGNHVVIEIQPGRYLFLAHLRKGTVTVQPGDTVRAGEVVGMAGNSGNTAWPHLHMHIQDMPVIDNVNAKAFPFRFRSMERKRWTGWERVQNGFLLRNDLFKSTGV
jgi:biotin carboxyl carrier protein